MENTITNTTNLYLLPKSRVEPTEIAPETFVIHDHGGEGHAPILVPLNSLVIRGAEPVVIDTGMAENRERYLEDVFSLVEPEDIRWLVISHDDVDHTGNVNALMELAPNATLVVNWFMQERMGASLEVSPLRQRWIGQGDVLDVGDRELLAVRPPIFDSPTTRGIFDTSTRVYWASDTFATPMLTPARSAAEIDHDMWIEGMATFARYVSPWLTMVDPVKFQATVDRIAALNPSRLVGCHTPVIGPRQIDEAFDAIRSAPHADIAPEPDEEVLAQIQKMLLAGV